MGCFTLHNVRYLITSWQRRYKSTIMNTKRTGRKPKAEKDKIKQKKVYISDAQEKKVLSASGKKSLTEVVLSFI